MFLFVPQKQREVEAKRKDEEKQEQEKQQAIQRDLERQLEEAKEARPREKLLFFYLSVSLKCVFTLHPLNHILTHLCTCITMTNPFT